MRNYDSLEWTNHKVYFVLIEAMFACSRIIYYIDKQQTTINYNYFMIMSDDVGFCTSKLDFFFMLTVIYKRKAIEICLLYDPSAPSALFLEGKLYFLSYILSILMVLYILS